MLVVNFVAQTDFIKFDAWLGMQYLEMFSRPISVIVNLFFHDVIYVCNLHYLLELASPRNNDSKIIPY